jgi:hypothetical protein
MKNIVLRPNHDIRARLWIYKSAEMPGAGKVRSPDHLDGDWSQETQIARTR